MFLLFRRCCIDGSFHDEYMTFKMPLPLPAVGVFVVSFPVEFILKTKEKKEITKNTLFQSSRRKLT